MEKPRVLLVQPIHQAGIDLLSNYDVQLATDPSEETLIREIKGVSGVILRTTQLTAKVIEAADQLRVISRHGVGIDNIDLPAATAKGIIVVNTPDANALSVAEFTVTTIAALAKNLFYNDREARRGNWEVRNEFRSMDLYEKKLGIIGLGKIGMQVAQKCQRAFEMEVIAYSRSFKPQAAALGIKLVDSLEELLKQADVISVNTPLTPTTRGMIGEAQFELMKPGVFFINTSRGEVVDEAALVKALSSGKVAGAALDVFTEEPLQLDNPLLSIENVIISPHMSALTKESAARMASQAAEGLREVLEKGLAKNIVNPSSLKNLEKNIE